MSYKTIPVSAVNSRDWVIMMNLDAAKKVSKAWRHKIFKIPNGSYVVRKPTGKRLTPELRRKLEESGQNSWR